MSEFNTGAPTTAPSLTVVGTGGDGYINFAPQTSVPTAPSGGYSLYADGMNNLTWKDSAGKVFQIDTSNSTTSNTWTLPDNTDDIVTATSTDTLTNKTISSANNTVDANQLIAAPIVGTPTTGDVLAYNAAVPRWQPLTLAASAPITYSGGTIGASVGSTAGTVAAGNDARFSSPQIRVVKPSGAGAGEYTTIAAALASITDAGPTKSYVVSVHPGMYITGPLTIPPFITVSGNGAGSSTIIVPGVPGGVLFTVQTRGGLNGCVLYGPGIGGGTAILLDSAEDIFMNNIVFTGFDTFIVARASVSMTAFTLFECEFMGTYTTAMLVDGTVGTSAFEIDAILTNITVGGDSNVNKIIDVRGPHCDAIMSNCIFNDIPTATVLNAEDGARVLVESIAIDHCNIGIQASNVGAGPIIRTNGVSIFDSFTKGLNILHPATNGVFSGIVPRADVFVDPAAPMALFFTDPVDNGTVIVGDFGYAPFNGGVITEHGALFENTSDLGVYQGGGVSVGVGLGVNVSAGEGYITTGSYPTHQLLKVIWTSATVSLSADTLYYIYVDSAGTALASTSFPDQYEMIVLARVRTTASGIEFIDPQRYNSFHYAESTRTLSREAIGALYSTGSVVAANPARELSVSSGRYFYLNNLIQPSGLAYGGAWFAYYHVAGAWTRSSQTIADNAQYDDGTGLAAVPAGRFIKHTLYTVGSGSTEMYFLVYGQSTFVDLPSAVAGNVATPPNYFDEGIVPVAHIFCQEGVSAVVQINDARPSIGSSGSAFAAVTDHGQLTGLLDDDHTQYLLVNGSRAMTGGLNMGSNAITSAGLINGVAIAAHASRHLPNGADPLTTAAPLTTLGTSTTNAVGTANSFARSDHTHAVDQTTFALNSIGGTLGVAKGGTGATTLTAGNFLVGNGTGAVATTKVVPAGTVLGTTDTQTLTNKTMIGSTNIVDASALQTTTAAVVVSGAAAPTTGQVLMATSATTAGWAAPGAALVDNATAIVDATDATKRILFDAGGTTGTSTTIAAVQTANRTLTLPDATDTLVARATTDTLTNKTLIAGSTAVVDGVDPTKILNVDMSTAGTGTTTTIRGGRTTGTSVLTLPNVASDTITTSTNTATLTNKTIIGSTNVVDANALKTTGASVSVAAASPPTAGQALVATTATTAEWSAPGAALVDTATNIVDAVDATKRIRFDAGGTTGTATTLQAAQTANRVLILPDTTDTLVGRSTADTLNNKTIVDATCKIVSEVDPSKQLTVSVSGSTAGTNTLLATTSSADITLVLPPTSDTLVGRDTIDTLQNKTMIDANCAFVDDSDSSRRLQFTVGGTTGITTTVAVGSSTNRTLTLPDATDTIVARATIDTLTNKTLVGGTNVVDANALKTTGASVSVVGSAPPSAGQTLVATSSTTAAWSAPGAALVDTATAIVDAADATKRILFDAGGTTGTATTIAATQTANRTLTLPNATTTVVGTDVAQVLTNKTITGATNTVDANALKTTGASVSVAGSSPPTAGQALVATGATTAAWSAPGAALVDTSTAIVDAADATKRILFDAGGTTGTATTIVAAQTANRTLTLPNTTDTLVGRATTDSLSNKSLDPANVQFVDVGVPARTLAVSLTGASAGTTLAASASVASVLTLPNTAADTLVGRATTDTLTNKFLSDSTTRIVDSADTSKQLAFDIQNNSGVTTTITTSNTAAATLAIPAVSSGTFLLTTAPQTMSFKEIQNTSYFSDGTGRQLQIGFGSQGASSTTVLTPTTTTLTTATISLPPATTMLVGRDTVDTLLNKSLVDNTTAIVDSADPTRTLAFNIAGTTGTTTTLIATPTASRALTLPDATDTLIGRATTDTLTSKTLTAASCEFADSADSTKRAATSVSGATTGTKTTLAFVQTANRTLTFPDATDTLVGRATTETLTNKTLTSPVIAQISNSGTLTLPTGTNTLIARATTDTLTNKTIVGATNVVDANALKTTGASVSVVGAAPPSAGQALVATSATTATWQSVAASLVDNTTFIIDSVDATKRIGFDAGGTTGTTTTLTSAQTANRTVSFPDATDTLVGRITTDTLQNKTLLTPTIAQIVNTGTLTLPTTTDTLVGRATTDTLTNKTLTLPVIAQISNSGTLTVPTGTDTLVARATTDTLTNKTITGITNVVDANALKTAGASVSVAAAGPPTTGQVLMATSATTAAWSAPGSALVDTATAIVDSADATKRILFDAGGTTGTATTIAAVQTAGRTITLPDATDTLVGRTTADTLTNKSLADGSVLWVNSGDPTKRLAVSLTNVSTATTNTLSMPAGGPFTWTFPDATSTLVGRTTVDTLTNKTLVGSSNVVDANALKTTGASVSVAGASPPSAGQVLVATSATVATWAAPGAALVDTATAIVDSVDATKQIKFDAGGTTSTATTILAAQTANRTLTLPDATDTLVGRTTADTMTNKTLVGATNTIDASGLRTAGASVVISAATAPTAGQALVATSATTAAWSAPGAALVDTATFIVDSADATKRIAFNAGGTTGTTTTITAAQTAGRVITLPDATDTLVGLATSDVLQNKTLVASNCAFADAGDNSKRVAFSASGSTAGAVLTLAAAATTSRTLTLPNATDTLVGRATTDTLSNKSLDWTNSRFIDVATPAKTFSFDMTFASAGLTLVSSATSTSTLTLPNISADIIVGESAAATLSNKLLRTDTCAFADTGNTTKRVAFAVSGATTGTTMTLGSSQTANRTLTLPDTTDTLVARATTDTLSNKTISADTCRVADATDGTKRLAVALSGATTGTTMTLLSLQTANRTLTLPDATDTLTGRNTVDTLANKSFADSTCKWVNNADPTKQLVFSLGGMTTGTTHTFVLPAGSADTWTLPAASDTLVGRATTDTLTNKTIVGATNTVDANALKTTGASVNVSGSAPPTAGQILTATGATTAAWSAPAAVSTVVDNVFRINDSVDATKRIAFDAGGTTGTTTTLLAAQTANRTLTLPDATDTLVGRATVDTLTAKTLAAGSCAFADAADTSKRIDTSVSGATTGTTTTILAAQTANRTLTLPDITDTITTNTNSADLSNKRLLDTTVVFAGAADTTKTLRFNLTGMSTATQHSFVMPSGSARSWTLPAATDTLVGLATTDTLTNKTIVGGTNTVDANALKTTGASVNVNASAPPTVGQALVATSATTATWQDVAATTVVDNVFAINDAVDATKQIKFDAGGTTATSTTIAASQTANRTLSLPDATDTLVGRATVDTLSNKTLTAGNCAFADGTDATKTLVFSLSGATTGAVMTMLSSATTARALTLPDATDTLVARNTTDTLTNKTITGATNVVDANALKTTGASVSVVGAAPPSAGQALVATSATTATWSTPWNTLVDTSVSIVDAVDATKRILFAAGGTTGTSTTFSAAQTANRTLSFPDATDTLVGRATTDTLTNKTLTGATNTVDANALKTTGSSVVVAGAASPSAGQALIATSSTAASWQNISVSSAVDNVFTINDATDATKQLKFDVVGNTGTSTTLTTNQSTNCVLTLPSTTDTLLGRTSTDTVANKTLNTTTCRFGETSDTTKRIQFELGSATTGTTMIIASAQTVSQVITLPDVTGTLVCRGDVATLTNKTIIGGSGGNTVSADQIRGINILATAPTTSQVLTYNGTAWAPAAAGGGITRWLVQEVFSVGQNAPALTAGSWTTRQINTLTGSANTSLTLSVNNLVFTAGTYYIKVRVPGNRVGLHKARLWNTVAAAVLVEGSSSISPATDIGETYSVIETYQTFGATTTLRVEHYVQSVSGTDAGGAATGVGTGEMYTMVLVDKLA